MTVRPLYFVTSHNNPEQVARLTRALRRLSPDAVIAVHHDYGGSYLDPSVLGPDVHLLRNLHPIEWGDASRMEMMLRCFRWSLDVEGWDWFVLLSGQDYPVRPLADLEAMLAGAAVDGFVEHARVGEEKDLDRDRRRDQTVRRYFYRYYRLPRLRLASRLPAPVRRSLQARKATLRKVPSPVYVRTLPRDLGARIGLRALRTPFRDGFACYKGSDWFTLSRRAVQRMIQGLDDRQDVVRHYRRCMNATESVFVTIMANDPELSISPEQLRFTSWPPGAPHPETLTVDDIDRMRASGKYIARKFDPKVDTAVLDRLDELLGIQTSV